MTGGTGEGTGDLRAYYERRAEEYDRTAYGAAGDEELAEIGAIAAMLTGLPPARTLDVGCGTAFLTRYLPGSIVGVDQSPGMLRIAAARVPGGRFVRADVPPLPFAASSFGRVFAAHLYGHLEDGERVRFLEEAGRVGGELVVVDQAEVGGVPAQWFEDRVLEDGTAYRVWKRYFTMPLLLEEVGGEPLFEGRFFLAVRRPG
ncbi:MAG: class I SAM-dependent methyltransferase [Actinobacteria bacterium]|nr:class I SAM-dependent methyltransferase [Actinomycetota bacterium]